MTLLGQTQKITYWPVAGVNANSAITYGSPIVVNGRYVIKEGIVVDEKGNKRQSMYTVYTTSDIPKRSLLLPGDWRSSSLPNAEARKLLTKIDNSSLSDLNTYMA